MPRDIVVDTNVFMHAGNPHVKFFDGALAFVEALKGADVPLCVDKQRADSVPRTGASLIWGEYERKMKSTTYGMVVLAKLAASSRLKFVSRDVGAAMNKRIRVLIPKDTRDKTFTRVAYMSEEKLFVSNDTGDFGTAVRRALRRELGIRMEYSDVKFATL